MFTGQRTWESRYFLRFHRLLWRAKWQGSWPSCDEAFDEETNTSGWGRKAEAGDPGTKALENQHPVTWLECGFKIVFNKMVFCQVLIPWSKETEEQNSSFWFHIQLRGKIISHYFSIRKNNRNINDRIFIIEKNISYIKEQLKTLFFCSPICVELPQTFCCSILPGSCGCAQLGWLFDLFSYC